jgi:hypothetical protein
MDRINRIGESGVTNKPLMTNRKAERILCILSILVELNDGTSNI